MSGVHSQNQFITAEQLQRQYLNELVEGRRRGGQAVAYKEADVVVNRVLGRLEGGRFKIEGNAADIKDLLLEKELTESAKRLLFNRKRNEEKQRINRLLYPRNKSQESHSEEDGKKVLSLEKHREFIREIKNQKMKRETKVTGVRERQAKEREKSEEMRRRKEEEERLESIERKKVQIQENLRKMKENHEKVIIEEKQSRTIFNQIRKKKRLYEHLKETYEERTVLPAMQENKKRLQEIKENSRLNLQQIQAHEKQYLEWKKSQASLDKSHVSSKNEYNPPPHSKKILRILAEEEKEKHKLDLQKRLVREKIERTNNYTALLKVRNPPPEISKTIAATQRQTSQKESQLSRRDSKSRNKLGNRYLEQARKALRQRAKTEERQKTVFTEKGQAKKKQSKAMSMHYIDPKKQKLSEQSKKDQIQKILSSVEYSPLEKLKKIQQADEKLSIQLRKKQSKLKLKFNRRDDQSALDVALTTIRAKLNLLEYYDKLQ